MAQVSTVASAQAKVCSRCNRSLPADVKVFAKMRKGRYGLHSRCRDCERIRALERYRRNPAVERDRARRYRERVAFGERPPTKERPSHRVCPSCSQRKPLSNEHFHTNRDGAYGLHYRCKPCELAKSAEWRKENADALKVSRRKTYERQRQSAQFRISSAMSNSIASALPAGAKRKRGWEGIVGYTASELRDHLAKQFTKGMSFENYGEWHVDHIVPVSSFRFDSYEHPDFLACWALSNLRPLWKPDNLRKQAIRTHLI